MGKPWDVKFADTIGKAIPNEFSKLNSYSNYLNMIPVIGPFISAAVKGGATADNAFTGYADTYDASEGDSSSRRAMALQNAFSGAQAGLSGSSMDPGMYGSGGDINRDWANTTGQIGNLLPSYSPGANGSPGKFTSRGDFTSVLNNPYLNKNADSSNMFGTQESGSVTPTTSGMGFGRGVMAGQDYMNALNTFGTSSVPLVDFTKGIMDSSLASKVLDTNKKVSSAEEERQRMIEEDMAVSDEEIEKTIKTEKQQVVESFGLEEDEFDDLMNMSPEERDAVLEEAAMENPEPIKRVRELLNMVNSYMQPVPLPNKSYTVGR